MPTTSKGFPYPSGGDTPNVPLDIQNLASAVDTHFDTKANVSSPTFTGTPAAPTADAGTNTTQIATTAFVRSEVSNLVASAPATLDTLDELAAALGDDANFATTVTNSLSGKLNTSGGTISGSLVVSGTLDANEIRENVVPVTLSSNLATCDWTAGNIFYVATAGTGAITVNVTNVPTDINKMMSINFILTQDATGRLPSTFQIDGATQTIRWPGGSAPTPTAGAGKIDIFSFTMQRTGSNTWIVYGASTLNF